MPTPAEGAFIHALDAALHPLAHAWASPTERHAALREEFGWELGDATTDLAFAQGFMDHQPVPGAVATDYLNRWRAVSPDLTVLCGPRFRGQDHRKPFVDVVGGDRPLTPADLLAIAGLARAEFALFSPLYARLWNAEPAYTWPGTRPDMRLLAGRLGDLRARPIPDHLTARPAQSLDFYPRYLAIYERNFAEHPDHQLHARAESQEDLADLLDQGAVLEVFVNGAWAGVLAARPDVQRGLRGATVVELALDHAFRGQGHGAHLSALLARHLPQPDAQCLLGTIHADNRWAYRSALRAGRHDLGGEVVLPL